MSTSVTIDKFPSPVPHLLGSNAIPSDTEGRAIEKAIATVQPRVVDLGKEIKRVRAVLDQLNKEHVSASDFVKEHKALLSPARRLIPELWSEIFARCVPKPSQLARGPSTFDTSKPPYVLLSVCSTWRSVALSTPTLWATISFPVRQSQGFRQTQMTKFWLERSRACPLSIHLFDVAEDWQTHSAVKELMAHCMRWQTLQVSLPSTIAAANIWRMFAPVKNKLPLLRRL